MAVSIDGTANQPSRADERRRRGGWVLDALIADPRERGGRKDAAFYQKVVDDPSLQSLAWIFSWRRLTRTRSSGNFFESA